MTNNKTVDNEINDKRNSKDFMGLSFSKFKKTDVKTQLLNSLINGKVENSFYWSAELICAGHFLDLWELIILCAGKHIHIGNPKLPIYIDMRIQIFKEIANSGYIGDELKMRNSKKIRVLFAELICILCFSRKMHSYNTIKIEKNEFNMTNLGFRLKADNVDYAKPILMREDPKELFVAINELAFCVSRYNMNNHNACYWIEWILEFENICRKKKEKCRCDRRSSIPVQNKFQMDIVWIIWELLLHESIKCSKIVQKIIKSLLNLFCIKYTPGVKKRRKHLIYFAVGLLTNTYKMTTPIIENKTLIENIIQKVDDVYKQVKKNELIPATDYLFHGIRKSNLEKSIEKMDIFNKFHFIPRD